MSAAPVAASGLLVASGPAHADANGKSGDPEELFTSGRFAAADRGFARILEDDPNDAHANARRGYIALMSNRFARAERFLAKAIRLDDDNKFARELLADCFIRQDEFDSAVPLLRQLDREAEATQYAAIDGEPYRLHGAPSTRIPWLAVDPLPVFEASVNGGEPQRFTFDTGGTILNLTTKAAEGAGLEAVATMEREISGRVVTMYLGVLGSFTLGDIEVRNIPVLWHDAGIPQKPGGPPTAGVVGRTVFHHFLTTLDYANRELVLRRNTDAQLRKFRAKAKRDGTEALPLWLAADHYHCTLGTLGDLGPKPVLVDTGGAGGMGIMTSVETAERAGVRVDHDRPDTSFGDDRLTIYPCFPRDSGLGKAVAKDLYGLAGPIFSRDRWLQFQTIANFTHTYLKPFTVTYDVVGMNLYIG